MLRGLDTKECEKLAGELRTSIIDICSINGGHIGASLGAVELTIALHSEFDSPHDSLVWDVGHQSYAHKLLTRPKDEIKRLRKSDGPSGFTSRSESAHDVFGAGHSSTSISAALGIAEAKQLNGDESWTVAIIGDGGLTAGLAFEALNQAGASEAHRLLIIVNDNNLSISANVGALNRWAFGAEREPRKFFESLGFAYQGPVDGHNIENLRENMRSIKVGDSKRVSILHVLTKKGKGFLPAENEPIRFHGVGPFDKLTGKAEGKPGGATYSKCFGDKAIELATNNHKIVAITAAMAEGTGLSQFSKKFPERFYDVGIAEPHALVFAAGMATQGYHPIVAIYSTFLQRGLDSVIHDIALQNLNVVVAIDRAGLVGADGPTHHGAFDISFLRPVPNVSIAAPSCKEDFDQMLEESLGQTGLKAIRYPRGAALKSFGGQHLPVKWGRGRVLYESDHKKDQVVVWGLGTGVVWAAEAISLLSSKERSRLTLVDARFAKPIDHLLLEHTLKGASGLITIEDGSRAGGFGSGLIEEVLERNFVLPAQIELMGLPNKFIRHAEVEEQRREADLSSEQIAERIRKVLSK